MTTVFQDNLLLLVIALLIGVVIACWALRGSRRARGGPAARPETLDAEPAPAEPLRRTFERVQPAPPPQLDTLEGNGLADEAAAATADVTGDLLGVQVHSELPGASGTPDNLQMIKGVGPKLAEKLNENGIVRFEQLAALSADEADLLDARLGPFKGRLARDRVVEQASYLARGDREGFEARFGKIGGGA